MSSGFRLGVKLQGSKEVRERLRLLAGTGPEAVAKALYLVGANVRTEAMVRAPLRYGALRNSAYLTMPALRDGDPVVKIAFSAPYAVYQHEGDFNHPRGGERYFLRKAFEAKASLQEVADKARELLERGVGAISPLAPTSPGVVQQAQRRAAVRRAGARVRRRRQREE